MVGVTLPDSTKNTYSYDADGLRRLSQTPTLVTKFIWDGQNVLIETNDNGNTLAANTQTPDRYGKLICQRHDSVSCFYSFDILGSTNELTDSSQSSTDSYRYYGSGKELSAIGNTVNAYRYVGGLGYYEESTLGLKYLRARWYDPVTGRFISIDPATKLPDYIYAENRPLDLIDASGLHAGGPMWKDVSPPRIFNPDYDGAHKVDQGKRTHGQNWDGIPGAFLYSDWIYCASLLVSGLYKFGLNGAGPNTSKILAHYMKNKGSSYTVPFSRIAQFDNARSGVERAKAKLEEFMQTATPRSNGSSYTYNVGMESFTSGVGPGSGEQGDWSNAIGSFEMWGKGTVTATCLGDGKKKRVTANVNINLWDYEDVAVEGIDYTKIHWTWDPTSLAKMQYLHVGGLAYFFEKTGSISVNLTKEYSSSCKVVCPGK